ncbi:DUF255 domain-containing protein [Candidatus Poribacteria bacterium]|nr:DUF255 domain-containing protein [Candidatus Poribacteria bacterium]
MNNPKHTNRLINETSPYLLQHAHNPVDWYPWGEEALNLAMEKDMPILLSIGYSACHWCHVMEHESFENEEIARLMNENFICIKVDREERPDLDEIYMNAVQAMTGSGGWPMTVFLTPDLKPFYAGTYFPPRDMPGRPGLPSILNAVSNLYRENREKVSAYSQQVHSVIRNLSDFQKSDEPLSFDLLDNAYNYAVKFFDPENGGFGGAPKFPQSGILSFLMRHWKRTNDQKALDIVGKSLTAMARGGVYDQIGGGFHRYSVDAKWLIPHFEKMLYDNALLTGVYLEYYQITKKALYLDIATETLDYLLRDMYNPGGGFYSTQDADTDGQEGLTYAWDIDEVRQILGDDARIFTAYYGMTEQGNFEHGTNVLHIPISPEKTAEKLGIGIDKLNSVIQKSRQKLFNEREKRPQPGKDDKIITAWNGLMISSMTKAYQVTGDQRYINSAIETANFILTKVSENGKLLRTHRHGESKLNAYADDYAFMIGALLDLYESDFDERWITETIRLNSVLLDQYWDEQNGGFFYTSDDHEKLIARTKSASDSPIPSANSKAAMNLLRLSRFTGDQDLAMKAEGIFRLFTDQMENSPNFSSDMICALDFFLSKGREIVITGNTKLEKTPKFIGAIHQHYTPNSILIFFDPEIHDQKLAETMPILESRTSPSKKTLAYICEDYTCKTPINELQSFITALSE